MATGHGLDQGIGVQVSVGGENFHFSVSSRPALGSTQPPIQWVPGALSPRVKWPGSEADHSPPTIAEVSKTWVYTSTRRSQWPRGLRREPSSPARTLGSWVWIPLKAWMSVYVYSVSVLFCVSSGLATGWAPVQGVLSTVYRIKKLKKRPRSKGL
jgi:hypothetical protein